MNLCEIWQYLPDFYALNLRNSLFTGLLTMGTFLFAVKTFIVVKLKEDVFDTLYYQDRIERNQKLSPSKKIERYAPLKGLTSLLYYASIVSLSSSVFQITLGLLKTGWSSLICIFAAFVSIFLLFWAMVLVKSNLNVWLEGLEQYGKDNKIHKIDTNS